MADQSTDLKLTVSTEARGEGAKQTVDHLKAVEAQAGKSAAAVEKLNRTQDAAPPRSALASSTAELNRQMAAPAAPDLAAEKLLATEQRRLSLEVQRAAIVSTEVEMQQALAAGQYAEAAALKTELAIMVESLAIQRAANVTEQEALVLARQKVQAEERIAAAKLRSREEARRLRDEARRTAAEDRAQQFKGDGGMASQWGQNIGLTRGPAVALGAGLLVAQQLSRVITEIGTEWNRGIAENASFTKELHEQVAAYREMAALATNQADVAALQKKGAEDISRITEQMRNIPEPTGWLGFLDKFIIAFRQSPDVAGLSGNPLNLFKTEQEKRMEALKEQRAQLELFLEENLKLAEQHATDMRQIDLLPPADQEKAYQQRIDDLKKRQAALREGKAPGWGEEWLKLEKQLEPLQKRLAALRESGVAAAAQLGEAFAAARSAIAKGLTPEKELSDIQSQIQQLRSELTAAGQNFGITLDLDADPEAALEALSRGNAPAEMVEQYATLLKLRQQELQLSNRINQTAKEAAQKAEEKAADAAAAAAAAQAETAILEAKKAKNEELVIELEEEEKVRKQIQSLREKNVNDPALFEQIKLNGELQKEIALRDLADKKKKARNQLEEAVENVKPGFDEGVKGSRGRRQRERDRADQLASIQRKAEEEGEDPKPFVERAGQRYDQQVRDNRRAIGGPVVKAQPENNLGAVRPAKVFSSEANQVQQAAQDLQPQAAALQSLVAALQVFGAVDVAGALAAIQARTAKLEAAVASVKGAVGK